MIIILISKLEHLCDIWQADIVQMNLTIFTKSSLNYHPWCTEEEAKAKSLQLTAHSVNVTAVT